MGIQKELGVVGIRYDATYQYLVFQTGPKRFVVHPYSRLSRGRPANATETVIQLGDDWALTTDQ
jgi:hypothetical protein